MAQDGIEQLVEKLKADSELSARFRSAQDGESFAALVAESGVEVTWEEVAPYLAVESSELSEAEMDSVAGGITPTVTAVGVVTVGAAPIVIEVSVQSCDSW